RTSRRDGYCGDPRGAPHAARYAEFSRDLVDTTVTTVFSARSHGAVCEPGVTALSWSRGTRGGGIVDGSCGSEDDLRGPAGTVGECRPDPDRGAAGCAAWSVEQSGFGMDLQQFVDRTTATTIDGGGSHDAQLRRDGTVQVHLD